MEEGAELVMDWDQEQEAARETMVEPTAGGARVELWLNAQAGTRRPTDGGGTRVCGVSG